MNATLKIASLSFGRSRYAVTPNASLPLPEVFDFDNVEQCARTILAIMSNAAGGHQLTRCRVRISKELGTANITSSGCHVYYVQEGKPLTKDMSAEEIEGIISRAETMELGTVVTHQYGDGWKHAVWK